MARQKLQLACAAVWLLGGCMTAQAAYDEEAQLERAVQAPRALTMGGDVAPGEFAGDCENGLGWYLSADDTTAALTVYVLTPAQSGVFERPRVHLVTSADAQEPELNEFQTVELQAGESRTFTAYAGSQLMHATAEVSAL
jgi:hypothetical protein